MLKQEDGRLQVLAEVPPALDTLVLFWSETVPHEVLPPWVRLRHAVSVWYLCPRRGLEHFSAGNAEAAFGESVPSAVEKIRATLGGLGGETAATKEILDQLSSLQPPELQPSSQVKPALLNGDGSVCLCLASVSDKQKLSPTGALKLCVLSTHDMSTHAGMRKSCHIL